MQEYLTVVTRKGQITLPAEVRKALGIKEGDKVAVSISGPDHKQAAVRLVGSVTDLTFGAAGPRSRPLNLKDARREFVDSAAERDERSKRQ